MIAVSDRSSRVCSICLAVVVCTVAGLASAGEHHMPTFEKTRPKGEHRSTPPLPDVHPSVPEVRFGDFRPLNSIDNFILARIKQRKAHPKPVCGDADFARRASLDLVGVIPPAADIRTFLRWKPAERRRKWVDLLLQQQQYADHWTTFWGDLLRERGQTRGTPRNSLKRFIHDQLLRNRPYDEWVRALLTATGKAADRPATAFVLRDRADANVLTVTVTQTFLGLQLKCAQCHNHPYDWWERKDFQGMAGFWQGTESHVYKRDTVFRRGRKIQVPYIAVRSRDAAARGTFLTGATSEAGRGRRGLADLVTRRDNPYFARVAVNRLWKKLMGVGLVDPPDNFGPRNPSSHPKLLDWLAIEFIEHDYDLKHILRLIANSRTYQQTTVERLSRAGRRRPKAVADGDDTGDGVLFDGMLLRRMTAEQFHDSILVATGRYLPDDNRFVPSIQVTYPPNPRSFLRTFGCTDRQTLLPRSETGSIQQSLTLLNGALINEAIRLHPTHPIRQWRDEQRFSAWQIVEALFVQFLTREPTGRERAAALKFVGAGHRDERWEDLQWALLNTREFQFIR